MADLSSTLHIHPENLPTKFQSQVVESGGEVIAVCTVRATIEPWTDVHSVYGRPSDLRAYADALNAAADLGDRRQAERLAQRDAEAEKARRSP